jgi:hypothetical protein
VDLDALRPHARLRHGRDLRHRAEIGDVHGGRSKGSWRWPPFDRATRRRDRTSSRLRPGRRSSRDPRRPARDARHERQAADPTDSGSALERHPTKSRRRPSPPSAVAPPPAIATSLAASEPPPIVGRASNARLSPPAQRRSAKPKKAARPRGERAADDGERDERAEQRRGFHL